MAIITGSESGDIIDELADGGSTQTSDTINALGGNDYIRMYHNFDSTIVNGMRDARHDIVNGGDGIDTLALTIQGSYLFDWTGSYDSLSTAEYLLTFTGIENFDITMMANGNLTLGTGADRVTLAADGSNIAMGAGADLWTLAYNGFGTVDMGADRDRLVIDWSGAPSSVYLSTALTGSLAEGYDGAWYIGGGYGQVTFQDVEDFTITGGNSGDTLQTGDGDDVLTANGGNDVLIAAGGADTIDGGSGIDALSIDLSDEPAGITIDLTAAGVQASGGADTIVNVESFTGAVRGSAFADTLVERRHDFDAVFNMGAGNDTVTVRDGNDTVHGEDGDDRLVVDYALAESSVYMATALTGDLAQGYAGRFYIGGGYAQAVFSGIENFTVTGGNSGDDIVVGDGNDVVSTGLGADDVVAGRGNDVLDGGGNVDSLSIDLSDEAAGVAIDLTAAGAQQTGGTGSITGFESFGGTVVGSAYADRLEEGRYNYNAVFAMGDGDDVVTVRDGDDTIDGQAGSDRLVVDYSAGEARMYMADPLSGTLAGGYAGRFYIGGGYASATFAGIEHFTLTGTASADDLVTGDGDDVVSTGAGSDLVTIGRGVDAVDGGGGVDALSIDLSDEAAGVRIDLLATGAQQTGGTGSVVNVESFFGTVTGSAFGDTLIEGRHNYDAVFNAGDGNDLVQVSDGNDVINGEAGNDRLVVDYRTGESSMYMATALTGSLAAGYAGRFYIGGGYAEAAFTGIENFTLYGTNSADTLVTGDGADVIATGLGSDRVTAGAGTDTLDGGDGIDFLSIDLSDDRSGVTFDLTAAGEQQSGGAGSVTAFESFFGTVTGSRFADVLIEGRVDGDATFNMGGGDDVVRVTDGNDVINGEAGVDRLVVDYRQAESRVYLSVALSGTAAAGYAGTYYIGGGYAQAQFTGIERFTILAGESNDTIVTGDRDDVAEGNGGNDTIAVGKGVDRIDGGAGIDALSIDLSDAAAGVTIDLRLAGEQASGSGDSVANVESFFGTVVGSRFGDVLVENRHNFDAEFRMGRGNDVVQVSDGDDTIHGEEGNDRLVVDYRLAESSVYLSTAITGTLAGGYSGRWYIGGGYASAAFTGIENFTVLGGASNDTLAAADGADVLSGGGGNDNLSGGGGSDVLSGGAGNDRIDGGTGIDTASFADATVGVTVSLAIAAAQNTGEGSDTLIAIENLVGSAQADTLTGNGGANELVGGDGDDVLDGGAGIDRMRGGAGDDRYFVDNTRDLAVEEVDEGYDTVVTSVDLRLLNGIEAVVMTGASVFVRGSADDNTITANPLLASRVYGLGGDDTITGGAEADRLYGDDGSDTLDGGNGDDLLDGGAGDDRMTGGAGDDFYYVRDAGDTVVEAAGGGQDRVNAYVDYVLPDETETLVLMGRARRGTGNALDNDLLGTAGSDTLQGLGGADTLRGLIGNDQLSGGDGADVLIGGVGKDTMSGGAGLDRFVFDDGDSSNLRGGADVISDFSRADRDRIDLRQIDAMAGSPADDAFTFIGTAAFSGVAGQLRYFVFGGSSYVEGDVDGDGATDFMVNVVGAPALVAGDFLL